MNGDKRGASLVGGVLWAALLLVIVGCVVIVGVMGRTARQKKVEAVSPEKPVPVRTATVRPQPLRDVLSLPGRTEPFVDVTLAAEKAGRVMDVGADEGDAVEAGRVLLRVDDRVWQAIMQRSEVEIRDAQRDLERWGELQKAGAVSQSEFDAVERRRRLAEIARDEAAAVVDQCAVRSPVAGVVDERMVDVGEHVGEGTPAFRVVDTSRIKVVVNVPERDVVFVGRGTRVEFRVSALANRVFTGEVAFVAAAASPESNSFRAELVSPNPGGELRAGMIVDVALVRRVRPDAVVVPLAAVVPRKGEHVVFTVSGDRAARHAVTIESISGQDAVLAAGLNPGDELVVDGQRVLFDGALVQVVRP